MYVLRLKRRTNLLKVSVVAVAVISAACLLALVARVEPSQAAFPGHNGKIAFTAERDDFFQIYTINPDGSGEINVSNDPTEAWGAAWSPDGTRIAFASRRDFNNGGGLAEIYVMNAD